MAAEGDGRLRQALFGNVGCLVNGQVFGGVFGDEVLLPMAPKRRDELLGKGAKPFEPASGRRMREYLAAPSRWTPAGDGGPAAFVAALDYAKDVGPNASAKVRR